ncbi:MAG TPA: ergothioneine biosynthesis glutamate--cysteine ligase EgtA [Streptosporangiaceae bacterium]|nr:ergothioneine biosynthesis glutamate--cysteine ligase EgtA [Streptosporangiaceae bacterium]
MADHCVQAGGSAAPRAPGNGQIPGPAVPRPAFGQDAPSPEHAPPPEHALSEEDAEAHVHGICFKTGPPGQVGVELEWLVSDQRDPALRVAADRVMQAVAGLTTGNPQTALAGGGTLSTEPGGQLELSSAPATSLGGCVAAAGADLATLRDATHAAGLRLSGHGLDPVRPPQRVLDLPRYAAMEEFFDRRGPWGRVMMCNTASVQVCVDAGQEAQGGDGYRSRWRLVHAIGPVLVAAFANSPVQAGQASGWRCTRQAVWSRLDPGRTRAPAGATPAPGGPAAGHVDPRDAWATYALDAELMCIRRDGEADWAAPPGLTFRDWLRGAGERRPTTEDLSYHLTTLFPPVRPHGHLELRMIDAQPADGWIVPTAVVSALLDDPKAADAALAATEPLWARAEVATVQGEKTESGDPWLLAAKHGPSDSGIDRASRACFEAADAALGRSGAPATIRDAVAAFTEKYVLRGRCPADDRLKESR